MPLLGAHMSIAGGYYKAALAASAQGMDVVQLFTKNNNQWRAKPITGEEAGRFRETLAEHNIRHPLSHSSYLINLASPADELWKKSIESMIVELERAELLGISHVVVHPGAHTTAGEEEGIERVAKALDTIQRRTAKLAATVLLENTAGQGTCLGWRFEQLAAILALTRRPERVGVCIDTCHAFAAGYPLASEKEYRATMAALRRTIGLERIKAFHLNDSKRTLGSRVDRHAHIGEGEMGTEPFRRLLSDRRFRKVPMYMETPKGTRDGEDLDGVNLRTLRALAGAAVTR